MTLKGRWLEVKASLDAIKAWHALLLAILLSGLFSYFGPRAGDDEAAAVSQALLDVLKDRVVASCNEAAKEDENKITFSEKSRFALLAQKNPITGKKEPLVVAIEGDYWCNAEIGGTTSVGLGVGEDQP